MPVYRLNPHGEGPMMACGHAANGEDAVTGDPVCVICGLYVVDEDARTVVPTPDLTGRIAKCGYRKGRDGRECDGHRVGVPSSPALAFFKHTPDKPFDEFYCGCWGWD